MGLGRSLLKEKFLEGVVRDEVWKVVDKVMKGLVFWI